MLCAAEIDRIRDATHGDPFAVLGPHTDARGETVLRVFLPGALAGTAFADVRVPAGGAAPVSPGPAGAAGTAGTAGAADAVALRREHPDGLFESVVPKALAARYPRGPDRTTGTERE